MVVHVVDGLVFPRSAIRFPVELRPPSGMRVEDPATWPSVEGRVEYVGGRLLYMPPCGDLQQDTVADLAYVLRGWSEAHRGFVVGTNEAGMKLGGEVRGADAAVWLEADATPREGRFRRVAPVLAVEVAGDDEEEPYLRDKARWYLDHGVRVVWLAFPTSREVVVVDAHGEVRLGSGAVLPSSPHLPGLEPEVSAIFAQVSRALTRP
jgi:Uma2 family endonuclease